MKIAIGSDNNGYVLKESLKQLLLGMDIDVVDVGTTVLEAGDMKSTKRRLPWRKSSASGEVERGILIDATGAASAIIANKVPGIRAAQVGDYYSAAPRPRRATTPTSSASARVSWGAPRRRNASRSGLRRKSWAAIIRFSDWK